MADPVPLRVRATAAARLGITLVEYDQRLAAGLKWCVSCKAWHRRSEFGMDRSRGDGLNSSCQQSRVRATGRPGARARRINRAFGLAWCRGCEAWLAESEVKHGACRAHTAEQARRWYAASPLPVRLRKRARKRRIDPIPAWWWEEALAEFGGKCAYGCGRPASTADHVWPVARGGQSAPTNVVPACPSCNSSKKDRDPTPWITKGCMAFPPQWDALIALNFEVGGPLEEVTCG